MKKLWVRVGVGGALESFPVILAAVQYLNRLHVGKPVGWRSRGVDTPNYWGADYVRIYWGDAEGNFISAIGPDYRRFLQSELQPAEL